jgi:hypothetical protein
MSLTIPCRRCEEGRRCEEVVTVAGFANGAAGAALRKLRADRPEREVLYLECPNGHVERYDVVIHPDGSITLPPG